MLFPVGRFYVRCILGYSRLGYLFFPRISRPVVFSISCITSCEKEARRSAVKGKVSHSHSRAHKFSWQTHMIKSYLNNFIAASVKNPTIIHSMSFTVGHKTAGGFHNVETVSCVFRHVTCLKSWQEITLNVLSTGRTGLRGEWRILIPKPPVTNSSKAWSGYDCWHKHTMKTYYSSPHF